MNKWWSASQFYRKMSDYWYGLYIKARAERGLPKIKEPTIYGSIEAIEIYDLIDSIGLGRRNVFIMNPRYNMTTIDEHLRMFARYKLRNIKPEVDGRDCEWFVAGLTGDYANNKGWWGQPIGRIISTYLNGHVNSILIAYPSPSNLTPTVYFVEAMNGIGTIIPYQYIVGQLVTAISIP